MIFAGTDLGVYQLTDDGTTWVSFNQGTVAVFDLKYKESAKYLLTATHGRGCFGFDIGQLVLPIELTSFVSHAASSHVVLNWTTATEKNNSGFDVEKSSDASAFSKIGFVKGSGTTTASKFYTDNRATGNVYYRLKQIDFDGKFTYSPT